MGNPRSTRTTPSIKAPGGPASPTAVSADALPPVGRKRGADPNRVIAWLTQQGAEKDQHLAAANALIDELEEALAAEQEASVGLRAQLVAATGGNGAADS